MSDAVLEALMDLKGDVGDIKGGLGELKAGQAALHNWIDDHVAVDAAAHARITALETKAAESRGAKAVWNTVSIGVGTAIGYSAQMLTAWIKGHP